MIWWLIVSWVASIMVGLGMRLLRQKNIKGWYLQIAGSLLFIAYSIPLGGFWGFAPLNMWLIYQSIKAVKEWKHEKT